MLLPAGDFLSINDIERICEFASFIQCNGYTFPDITVEL